MKCRSCNAEVEFVIVRQVEEHFYKYFPDTDQLEDFHGDETVLISEYLCSECNGVIKTQEQL